MFRIGNKEAMSILDVILSLFTTKYHILQLLDFKVLRTFNLISAMVLKYVQSEAEWDRVLHFPINVQTLYEFNYTFDVTLAN